MDDAHTPRAQFAFDLEFAEDNLPDRPPGRGTRCRVSQKGRTGVGFLDGIAPVWRIAGSGFRHGSYSETNEGQPFVAPERLLFT